MLYRVTSLPLLVAVFFVSGCANSDLMIKRQAEAEARIEHLIQTSAKREQRQNEFAAQLQACDEQLQALTTQFKQLQDSLRELQVLQDSFKARLQTHSPTTPKIEVVNPVSGEKPGRESGPPADYLKAFGLYSANNCGAAVPAFEEFIAANRASDYAANALYWIGECHVTASDFSKAKEAFTRLLETYPASSKSPEAQLNLGYALAALNDTEKAREAFQKLITLYPGSPAAGKARERLSDK